jgi:hypothetical protein
MEKSWSSTRKMDKNGGLSSRTWDSCGETEGKSLGFN